MSKCIQVGDIVHTEQDTHCIVRAINGNKIDIWVWRENPWFSEQDGDNPEDQFCREIITVDRSDIVRIGN